MLWIGQLLSDTGTEIGLLAYPLLILALLLAPAANAALFAVMLRSAPEEMRGRVTNPCSWSLPHWRRWRR